MASCLGLYVEENIIKYAKVSKEKDEIKVEAFGIKFYDKIEEAIKQVVAETYSYNIPISVNTGTEQYDYFMLFSLLSKKDLENVIDTEFESVCYDKGINKEAFECKYISVPGAEDAEKVKILHIAVNKSEIEKRTMQFDGQKVSTLTPISIGITNLISGTTNQDENFAIVNIEENTTVTIVVKGSIAGVEVLPGGMAKPLQTIKEAENSYSKAYEICKNTTIYTKQSDDLKNNENLYLEEIMPALYDVVGRVDEVLSNQNQEIQKVYITGIGSNISNVDLYFQEYLVNYKCEILRPFFIQNVSGQINIKDYIEVNSAIALALQGLGMGVKTINFKKEGLSDKLGKLLSLDVATLFNKKKIVNPNLKKEENKDTKDKKKFSLGKINLGKIGKIDFSKFNFKPDFNEPLTRVEKNLIRALAYIFIVLMIYSAFTMYLGKKYETKMTEADKSATEMQAQIDKIDSDTSRIKAKKSDYETKIANLQSINDQIRADLSVKKTVPTLLNQIMYVIPKGVQITSITNTNTSDKTIKIEAQAEQYEQLGYFVAALKSDNILTEVTTNNGQKQDGVVKITIEGKLP